MHMVPFHLRPINHISEPTLNPYNRSLTPGGSSGGKGDISSLKIFSSYYYHTSFARMGIRIFADIKKMLGAGDIL